jgi:glycosyltransferase involved in cell wall biosynthesis
MRGCELETSNSVLSKYGKRRSVGVENISEIEALNPIPRVYVIIPALNEGQAIGNVLEKTERALRMLNHEIVVVDGFSADDTALIAKDFGAVVLQEKEHGYGGAYLTGFEYALSDGEESIVVMMDADSTYDPNEIPALIEPILEGKADLVLSNRFANIEQHAMSLRNRLGNKVISKIMSRLYRMDIHDSQTGFRAISSKCLRRMFLEAYGMPFATEMLIEARKIHAKVIELPGTYHSRVGESKVRPLHDGYGIVWTAVRLCSELNPFMIYGTLGGLFVLLGVGFGAYAFLGWYQWQFLGMQTWPRLGSALLSVLFLVGGTVVFSLGILLDTLLRHLRSTAYRQKFSLPKA